jgi:hypothetical protein
MEQPTLLPQIALRDFMAAHIAMGLFANPKLQQAILKNESWISMSVWLWTDELLARRDKDNR